MKRNIVTCIFLFFLVIETYAVTRYVTPTGAGTMDGTSWANAFPGTSLQVAINASSAGDEVWVAAGIYYTTTTTNRAISFNMRNGVTIYGSFNGTEAFVSERDLTNGLTSILSGEIGTAGINDNSYKVVYNEDLDATAIIDGFVIEGGNDDRSPTNSGNGLGGGMTRSRSMGTFLSSSVSSGGNTTTNNNNDDTWSLYFNKFVDLTIARETSAAVSAKG